MNNHSNFFHSHRLAVLMEVLNPVSSVFAFLSRTIEEALASKIFLDELNVLMAQQKYCTSEIFHRQNKAFFIFKQESASKILKVVQIDNTCPNL